MICWSIFLGQHDRDHSLGDGRISRVRRMHRQGRVVIIDLEEDPFSICIEGAKVVLLVGIIGVTKGVVNLDGLYDPLDRFFAECREPSGAWLCVLVVAEDDEDRRGGFLCGRRRGFFGRGRRFGFGQDRSPETPKGPEKGPFLAEVMDVLRSGAADLVVCSVIVCCFSRYYHYKRPLGQLEQE